MQFEQAQQLVDASRARRRVEPVYTPKEIQISARRHLVVQARRIGHQPHARSNGGRVNAHIAARHDGFAAGRREQTGQQTHRGGLAGAIRSK